MKRYRVFLESGGKEDLIKTITKEYGDNSIFSIDEIGAPGSNKRFEHVFSGKKLAYARMEFSRRLGSIRANACVSYIEAESDSRITISGEPLSIKYKHKIKNVVMIRTLQGIVFVGEDAGYSTAGDAKFEKRAKRLVDAQRIQLPPERAYLEDSAAIAYKADEPVSPSNIGEVVPEIFVFNNNVVSETDITGLLCEMRANFFMDENIRHPEETAAQHPLHIWELPYPAFIIGIKKGHNDERTRIITENSMEIRLDFINPNPSLYAAAVKMYSGVGTQNLRRLYRELNYLWLVSELPVEGFIKKL